MSIITIDVHDYITETEKKQIAIEEFAATCSHHFATEENFKRILSNSAYDIVYQMVDKVFDDRLDEELRHKVSDIISSLNCFSIFKKPEAWSRETNSAYDLLQQAIISNKGVIEDAVRENISENVVVELKENVKAYISEAVLEHFNAASK